MNLPKASTRRAQRCQWLPRLTWTHQHSDQSLRGMTSRPWRAAGWCTRQQWKERGGGGDGGGTEEKRYTAVTQLLIGLEEGIFAYVTCLVWTELLPAKMMMPIPAGILSLSTKIPFSPALSRIEMGTRMFTTSSGSIKYPFYAPPGDIAEPAHNCGSAGTKRLALTSAPS